MLFQETLLDLSINEQKELKRKKETNAWFGTFLGKAFRLRLLAGI